MNLELEIDGWKILRWPGAGDRANTHAAIIGIGAFYSKIIDVQALAAYKFAYQNGLRLRFFYNEGCANERQRSALLTLERMMRDWENPFIGKCDKIGFDRAIKSVDFIIHPLTDSALPTPLANGIKDLWQSTGDRNLFKAGTCEFQKSALDKFYPDYDVRVEEYRKIFHEGIDLG